MSDLRPVLIVEDHRKTAAYIERVLRPYASETIRASDGGEAMKYLESIPPTTLGAVVLDVMLPYGTSAGALKGDTDPRQIETGIRLLEWVRECEGGASLWVAAVTACSQAAELQRIEELLGEYGRLYRKPFDGFLFEHEMARALGQESLVPDCFRPSGERGCGR